MEVQEPRRSYGDEGAVARRALGVGGGEDGVHEDERADDLGGEGSPDGVAGGHLVGAATEGVVGVLNYPLHDAHAQMAPRHCATMYSRVRTSDSFRPTNSPNVTAGLMCPPIL